MKLIRNLGIIVFFYLFQFTALAVNWPQEITTPKGQIIIYQPQPEKLEGNRLFVRSAVSIEGSKSEEPIFGVIWFNAQIDTDQNTGNALVHDLKVERVKWSESTKTQEDNLTSIIENFVPESGFEISLARLSASLANAEVKSRSLEDIKNEAPVIVFSEKPSVLLIYDGKPVFKEIEDTQFKRAVNTPYLIASNKDETKFYLSNGSIWYSASAALGPWAATSTPPPELVKLVPKTEGNTATANISQNTIIPEIVVATKPTELIVSSGKPSWVSLASGKLLYVKNTESPWLREISSNNHFVLLSGRWYSAKNQNGPWAFVRSDELPASFADIPATSDIGGVRTSIAGTEEANDAVLDFYIPQTAAVKRSEATLTVTYDGKPVFEKIVNTQVSYATNTAFQVLFIGNHYYAVDNGIWFKSKSASGPWVVADNVPNEQIASIPASSPVYNTTYVHVYHSTPDVVYVGYTPGYMWSFPYYGVPIYGTGWRYPPYYGAIYYPRPVTWGMHVGYNPYTGWNYGLSVSNGFLSVGIGWNAGYGGGYGCCYGGYRGPIIINPGPRVINTGDINIGNSINAGNRNKISKKLANNPNIDSSKFQNSNLYNKAKKHGKIDGSTLAQRDFTKAKAAKGVNNNVYADRDGNVFRRSNDKWQSRESGKWRNNESLSKREFNSANRKPRSYSSNTNRGGKYNRNRSLNNAHNARKFGTTRERRNVRVRRR